MRWPKWVWVAEPGKGDLDNWLDKSFRKRGVSSRSCMSKVTEQMRGKSASEFNRVMRSLGYTEVFPRP